jgi:hypothetical protein
MLNFLKLYPPFFCMPLESGSSQSMGKQAAGSRESYARTTEMQKVEGTLVE